jgi:hypothetical protein
MPTALAGRHGRYPLCLMEGSASTALCYRYLTNIAHRRTEERADLPPESRHSQFVFGYRRGSGATVEQRPLCAFLRLTANRSVPVVRHN